MNHPFLRILLAPFRHFMTAFGRVLPEPPWVGMALLMAGFVGSWFLYVPAHELLHAFGCLWTGGDVDRLEIDAMYGARSLQKVFPFVAVGSRYAGQLTGFDTHGSDAIYLATDFAPFLLSVFLGIPIVVWLGRHGRAGKGHCLWLGTALPLAFAPFTNLVGDYYEMGSIVTSRIARLLGAGGDVDRWRGDDVFLKVDELLGQGSATLADGIGISVGMLVGTILAYLTYYAGVAIGHRTAGGRSKLDGR